MDKGPDRAGDPIPLQRQAQALGDPTRYEIYRFVAEAGRPVRVAALTEHLGLNHSAIRQHLGKLCHAGLLREEMAPRSGPGRPALQYRLGPMGVGTWATPSPYERLSMLLLDVAATGETPRAVGQAAGRASVDPDRYSGDVVDGIEAEMARWAFEPRRVERGPSVELVLEQCPFETAAAADPDIVCQLHLGLAEGMSSALGGLEVRELVPKDPSRAGCRLKMRRTEEGPP